MPNGDASKKVLMSIEVRYDKNGHLYANSHHGWFIPNHPQQPVQCQIFSRDNYRIKVAVYGLPLENLHTFGAYLAAALIDGEKHPSIWRKVELSDCDR